MRRQCTHRTGALLSLVTLVCVPFGACACSLNVSAQHAVVPLPLHVGQRNDFIYYYYFGKTELTIGRAESSGKDARAVCLMLTTHTRSSTKFKITIARQNDIHSISSCWKLYMRAYTDTHTVATRHCRLSVINAIYFSTLLR